MTFLSKYERANAELRKAPVRHAREGLTPEHTQAMASLEDGEQGEPAAGCEPDSVQAFRDAYDVPTDYPQPIRVISPEDFRRGPIVAGQEAPSPGACA